VNGLGVRVRQLLLLALIGGCSSSAVAVDESLIPTSTPTTVATTAPTTTAAPITAAPPDTQPAPVIVAAVPAATEAIGQAPATAAPPAETLPAARAIPTEGSEPYVELGTIEIPALGVVKPMLEGVTMSTLDRGPGHWPGTAMPGHQGNVVIAGHRVSHDKPFRNVDRLVAGNEVILTTADGRFVYHVVATEIVAPDAVWIVNQSPDYTATLFACHPPGSTRQRIVVHLALAT
jgi:sortase A